MHNDKLDAIGSEAPYKRIYMASIVLGLVPLVGGLVILLLWIGFRSDKLLVAGLYNIGIGLILFLCGILCLCIYLFKARRYRDQRLVKKTLLALFVLFMNFPAAALCIYTVITVVSQTVIHVVNRSTETVTELQFQHSGGQVIGSINVLAPFETGKITHKFSADGSVKYFYRVNNIKYEGLLTDYVTSGPGAAMQMNIFFNGEIEVAEK